MSKNIKLIVCDVDGTLLQANETALSNKVLRAVSLVKSSGIKFAVASGRSRNDLLRLFGGDKDIFYISSDGALTSSGDKAIFKKKFSLSILKNLLPKLNGADFVLYSDSCAYASSDFAADMIKNNEGKNIFPLSYINSNTEIFKLSITGDMEKAAYGCHYISANRILRQCYKSREWTEFVLPDADKGNALGFIQNTYDIKYEETVAFGDNKNDIPLLKKAFFSYAAQNALPEVKTLARFLTSDIADTIVNNFLI